MRQCSEKKYLALKRCAQLIPMLSEPVLEVIVLLIGGRKPLEVA